MVCTSCCSKSASSQANQVPSMRISRTGAPTLLSSNQPRQRKPSLNRTRVSSFPAPTPPLIPVPPPLPFFWAAPLVPEPPKNLSRSDTTRSLPTGDTNRDGVLVVYSSISTRPASDLLSHEDLRPRSRYAVLAITNHELERATLAPADRSLDGCLVGPVQACDPSTSIDLLAGPIVEEPVTPPAVGVASYHSTGDLTVEYLEDKPHSAGTRGLLLEYDDSSSTASAGLVSSLHINPSRLSPQSGRCFQAGPNVRDTQSAVGVESPLRSAFAPPMPNLDGRRTLRRSRTLSAVRFVEPPPPVNERTTTIEGFAAATCGELGNDTASLHAVGANVVGQRKVPYRSQSWDFSQDDSAEIQRKFLKHTNQHMRRMLSREQL